MLLTNYLLILELEQLSLLFKICDDLTKAFLKEVDFSFQQFDFLVLFKLLLSLLLDRLTFGLQICLDCFIFKFNLSVFIFEVG